MKLLVLSKSKKAENSIRSSEQLFRSLIEQTSDAIFVLQDDNIVLVNPAWIKLFGYSYEEATENHSVFMILLFPNIGRYSKEHVLYKKN